MMYQKNEYIFSEVMGVCLITDIVKLATKRSIPVPYYLLQSVQDKKKISYIPVENHQVKLRDLITPEEAKEKQKQEQLSAIEKEEIAFVLKENMQKAM